MEPHYCDCKYPYCEECQEFITQEQEQGEENA
jgi:hypothetical protein